MVMKRRKVHIEKYRINFADINLSTHLCAKKNNDNNRRPHGVCESCEDVDQLKRKKYSLAAINGNINCKSFTNILIAI